MWPFKKAETYWSDRYAPLATYNSEVARGLLHTEEWKTEMVKLQADYDETMLGFYASKGYLVV